METENSVIKIEPNIYLKVLLIKDYIITSLVDAMIVLSIFSMNFSKQKSILIIAITIILNLIIVAIAAWVYYKNNSFKEILISNDTIKVDKEKTCKISELRFIDKSKYAIVVDSNENTVCILDKNNKKFSSVALKLGIKYWYSSE